MDPRQVLDFWFGTLGADGAVAPETAQRWWKKDPVFDAEIATLFLPTLEAAARGALDAWAATPEGRLALVIVLDQFSRNVFRDTPRAFAQDPQAQRLTLEGLAEEHDRSLPTPQRAFLYMPLMHAEDRVLQARSVEKFQELAAGAPTGQPGAAKGPLDFARKHRDIVERFGRFPHRNAILGRDSTPDEIEFLKTPGSSF